MGRDVRCGLGVVNLKQLALQDHPARLGIAAKRPRVGVLKKRNGGFVGSGKGCQVKRVPAPPNDGCGSTTHQAIRTLCDGVEYRLHVVRRTCDDLQDVARCRLLLKRIVDLPYQPRNFCFLTCSEGGATAQGLWRDAKLWLATSHNSRVAACCEAPRHIPPLVRVSLAFVLPAFSVVKDCVSRLERHVFCTSSRNLQRWVIPHRGERHIPLDIYPGEPPTMSAFVVQSIVRTPVSAEGYSRRFVALPITYDLT